MQEKAQILIVDDERQMLSAMESVIARLGHSVLRCLNGKEALEILSNTRVDLVISDMKMPVMSGAELLKAVREDYPRLPIVMVTAYGTIAQAVEAMKAGAYDFITKPFSAEDLERVIGRAVRPSSRTPAPARPARKRRDSLAIVTGDAGMKRVLELAEIIAPSSASVLIQGESGTGKELIARLIHKSSPRSSEAFVAVNCAALPDNLLESELFGHEKGAFTGAVATKIGKFEAANRGTILLDEISEMEALLQSKLLRVLQEREVDRVGGAKPVPVDVRVVATTNRDIRQMVRENKFREDLYYRLNVVPLYVPALRERDGDIELLLDYFVKRFTGGGSGPLSREIKAELMRYRWPGNVRELENACQRAVLLADGSKLSVENFLLGTLSDEGEGAADGLSLRSGITVAEAEKRLILETLRASGNNRTKAAELLGISIRTLRNKLNEYKRDTKSAEVLTAK